MQLPNEFKCAGFTIKVEIHNKLPNNDYGNFDDARNVIKIAKKVEVDGEDVTLSEEQIDNTFFHELIHCFQFYFNNGCSEEEAQTFSNFICEYRRSIKFTCKCEQCPEKR